MKIQSVLTSMLSDDDAENSCLVSHHAGRWCFKLSVDAVRVSGPWNRTDVAVLRDQGPFTAIAEVDVVYSMFWCDAALAKMSRQNVCDLFVGLYIDL